MSNPRIDLVALAASIAQEGAQWTSGETSMTALSEEQVKARLGFVPPPGTPSIDDMEKTLRTARQRRDVPASVAGAPSSFDLRNVDGRNFVTPIRDQGGCGSCVSFGVVAVLESTLMRAANDPTLDPDLSEAHLFYCHGRRAGRRCASGWWPEAALDACRDNGLAFERSYPYAAGDQDCSSLNPQWRSRYVTVGGHHGVSGAAIKEWIATRGPVTGCFIVYQDFMAYRNGVYRHVSGGQVGGHCVALVGYDDAAGCWIAKNSWGPGWGESGFFRIAYGECGIDSWSGPHAADSVAIAEQPERVWSGWNTEGGVLTSNIACAANRDGRLEIFARGTDNALWHKWQDSPGGGWSGWASQGGVLTSEIAVERNQDGRLEIFVRGTDNALWHQWQESAGGGWSGWASQGGVLTSDPSVGRNADGRLEVFARGTDNALWHQWQESAGGGWSQWATQGGLLTSNIAVALNADGRLEIFARGTDNAVWHKWQVAAGSYWSDWASEGGVLTSEITVGQNQDGRLEVFGRGTDGALWHKWQVSPGGGWSDWASEGGRLTSNIAVGRSPGGRLEVFVRGTDGALWHKWQLTPNSGWSDWASEGGVLTSDIAVGTNADGRLELFVRGTDGALWHDWQLRPIALASALVPLSGVGLKPPLLPASVMGTNNGQRPSQGA
jgi:C1A family cysteine protease